MRIGCFVLLAGTSACTNPLCGTLIGEHSGSYEGDLAGDLDVSVTEAEGEDEAVDAEFQLFGSDGALAGSGHELVYCEDGQIVLDLRSPADDSVIGSVDGTMTDEGASGAWSMESGESGTWSY